ncbi:MAG: CBS domain-containing protein [Gemmatales bacterium]|nr:CBS domain-containing protein [Gemmatales bacterium]MDW8176821.1 CBS domain-containing protein [Gemmatales bacterium]
MPLLHRNLRREKVGQLTDLKNPLALPPHASVREAVRCMQERRMGCVLVCEGEKLVGIFTERDLLRRVLALGKPLSLALRECMTPNPVTVRESETIGTALRRMQQGGYRHLPVVSDVGTPVAILSIKRIIRYIAEHMPELVYNQPPDPHQVQQEYGG